MSYQIKFGTDGWREIIAENYTVANVRRIALATAEWNNTENTLNLPVVVGYDCRFGGKMFAENTARIFAENGIKVILSNCMVSTPMVSLAAVKLNAFAGIIITASHNPPEYNGYKIKAAYGGPAVPSEVDKVEKLIRYDEVAEPKSLSHFLGNKQIEYYDFESLYLQHAVSSFDLNLVQKAGKGLAYDAMFGAGQSIVRKLIPDATFLHCEINPSFNGTAPEPISKNLVELSDLIRSSSSITCGLATDGDADRIGFFDSKGNFIDSHHLILLLTLYLVKEKGVKGKIVKSFSVSQKVDKMASILSLETITTKIGFKYICEYMVKEDVLIGAEESGGIAIKGHIPERDGVWMGLVLLEYMAKTNKSIEALIEEVYTLVGSFAVERYDLHITEEQKQQIINTCKNNPYQTFDKYKVERIEDLDGYKFFLGNDEWVLIRPSGTEPVLRTYAESGNSQGAFAILDAVKATILA